MTTTPKHDLGSGVSYSKIVDSDDAWIGLHIWHANCPVHGNSSEDNLGCIGTVWLTPLEGRPSWTVESWEPLTISPSILRKECGLHGWIREGRWVAA